MLRPADRRGGLGGVRGEASDISIEAEEILKMRERLNREIAQPILKEVTDRARRCPCRPRKWIPVRAVEGGRTGGLGAPFP